MAAMVAKFGKLWFSHLSSYFLLPLIVIYNIPNLMISFPGIEVHRRSTMVAFFIFITIDRIPLEAIILSVCIIANYYIGSHGIWKKLLGTQSAMFSILIK